MSAAQPRHHLRLWRQHYRLTQDQLAQAIGVGRPYLSKVETGDRPYTQEILEGAAEALSCSPGDLIGRHPDGHAEIAALWASLSSAEQGRALAMLKAAFDV